MAQALRLTEEKKIVLKMVLNYSKDIFERFNAETLKSIGIESIEQAQSIVEELLYDIS
jgi:hypothetical protein